MPDDVQVINLHGWIGGDPVAKWWRGKFIHLYRFRKPCAQCNAEMVIDITKAATGGTAKNAGLHLTRCEKCRATPQASTSRPVVLGAPASVTALTDTAELEQLRSFKTTVSEELKELDALRRELHELKSRYRIAESTPPLTPQKTVLREPLTMAQSTAMLRAQIAKPFDPRALLEADLRQPKNNPQKMPWEA